MAPQGARIRAGKASLVGKVGIAIVVGACAVALFAPMIVPYDPTDQDYLVILQPPSWQHWLGTDPLGRDILSRIIYGTRISLIAGTISIAVAALIGTPLGVFAGFSGKWVDDAASMVIDSMMSFPPLVLALGITAALGPSLVNVMIAIGFVYIPYFARLARGQTLQVRQREHIAAAVSVGASSSRIVVHHVLPNIINPILVQSTINVAFAMLWEASLSFLGVGVQPPIPSWGSMLREGYGYIALAWWVALPSGVAIVIVVLGFSLLGDQLRDALDPRVVRLAGTER